MAADEAEQEEQEEQDRGAELAAAEARAEVRETLTALSLHSNCTLIALSLHSNCTLTAL